MIVNQAEQRFELAENGLLAWVEYRVRDGVHQLMHVEADPPLRGTGAASRLMQQIVEHARSGQLTLKPHCSYARTWFARHPQATDITV